MTPPLGRKQKAILSLLSEGGWVRGADIARHIGVTSYVLWPYIERLRWRGYSIEGAQPLGYRLLCQPQQAAA